MEKSFEILDKMEMPVQQRGGGRTGSKYFADDVKEVADALKPGQGFYVTDGINLKDPKEVSRYRNNLNYYINQWGKSFEETDAEGKVVKKGRKFTCAIAPNKGIAVRRDA